MRKIVTLITFLIACVQFNANAQVAINTDASAPDASAMLDIKSTTKGFLAPRLTTAQRTTMVLPADGVWVYDTDTKSFWYYKAGAGWQQMNTGGGAVSLVLPYTGTGNTPTTLLSITNNGSGYAISGSSTNGIGTYGAASSISGAGLLADNTAGGEAIVGRNSSTLTATGAVVGRNDGAGYGVYGFLATNTSGTGIGVAGRVGINSSTGRAGFFENINSANTKNTVEVVSNAQGVIADHSQGNAGSFFANNTNGVGAGVRGEVNSIFGNNGTAGVYGISSGTGGYGGYFEHSNSTGFGWALYATNAGLGVNTHLENTAATNTQATLEVTTAGTGNGATVTSTNNKNATNIFYATGNGPGVIADHSQGNAGSFFMNNTNGVGAGVRGEVNSIFGNNGTAGVYGTASGTGGYGGYFEHSNTTGFGMALYATNAGLGVNTHLENVAATNAQATLEVTTAGTGNGATVTSTNNKNAANILYVTGNGPGVIADHSQGNAGNFFMNNTNGVGAGVRGEVNSIFGNNGTAGVYGTSSGTGGYGGYFEHSNATGFGMALYATNAGLGTGTHLENTAPTNAQTALEVVTVGTGSGTTVTSTNNKNTANILSVTGNGPGVIADHSQGNAGSFFMNNTYGVGAGVRGEVNSIFGNNGTAGVYGVSSGTGGYAGYFEHKETTGFGITLFAVGYDKGTVSVTDQEGTGNDIAIFETGGANKARIDRNGKAFFNGGTQNSGADLAEAFDVEGDRATYEPGDVLEISVNADRTVAKSTKAYSTLVAGVYATKPGVLLTEEIIDTDISGKVPMGVVGVIPTKICNENGAVQRGDLLVTSSRPGYAMKADMDKVKPGQIIGKALEAFDGTTGKIKVLVNVK